jgi:hypothetical protein
MAVYKIFPEKSTTLYSYYPITNTGIDEILDLSTYKSAIGTNEVSRFLIKFPSDQISDTINNKVSGSDFDVYLKAYLANASSIPLNYTLFSHPVSKDWNQGTGRLANVPITTDGASWAFTDQSGSVKWIYNDIYATGTTGSYSGSNEGGGTWVVNSLYQSTQSFTNISDKDIELKVTNVVKAWNSGSFGNYGFILKHSSSLEFTTASKFELKYFSANTHTIYPPALEFRWNDSSYNTGSLTVFTSSLCAVTMWNNKAEFQQDSVQRFRVNVRDQYPSVAFRTSISYANSKALPSSSYWSIKDLDTEEIVVDYDTSYTKISCDSSGNYFNVYMNGLEPERYYKVLIKSVFPNGETTVFDENYIFKVIR